MGPRKGRTQHTGSLTADEPAPSYSPDTYVKNLNLSVLQNHDPEVLDYAWVAPYAVLYVFSRESQQWEKSGIEGSLFICTLHANDESENRYKVILLNRRGLDNFNFELKSEDQVEFTNELIIFQDNDSQAEMQVHGMWVFSEPEPSSTANQPKQVAELLQSCLKWAQESRLERASEAQQTWNEGPPVQQENIIPQSRQLSLSEIFGQQRQQDAGWATHNPDQVQPYLASPHWEGPQLRAQVSTDQHIPQQAPSTMGGLGTQQKHLLNLFQKAKFDQNPPI